MYVHATESPPLWDHSSTRFHQTRNLERGDTCRLASNLKGTFLRNMWVAVRIKPFLERLEDKTTSRLLVNIEEIAS